MFKFLLFVLLIVILLSALLRLVTKIMRPKNPNGQNYNAGNNTYDGQRQTEQSHTKQFSKNEGQYVDYVEIKDEDEK